MKSLAEMENSGLIPMLRDDKYDDLARMYQLFRRVEGGALLIRTLMSEHVKEVGKQLVQDPETCKVRARLARTDLVVACPGPCRLLHPPAPAPICRICCFASHALFT